MSKDLFSQENLATLIDEKIEDAWERKVLQTFTDGERIIDLPAREKKKLVILKWLADKFEYGERYSEQEISERLEQYNPDYATLRRYLVEYGYMDRDKGVYWRIEPIDSG
jgi:hypothetical protein